MTLNEFKNHIDGLVRQGHGDKIVISSCDDEGNGYCDVFYPPSVLKIKDIKDIYSGEAKKVAVCIN